MGTHVRRTLCLFHILCFFLFSALVLLSVHTFERTRFVLARSVEFLCRWTAAWRKNASLNTTEQWALSIPSLPPFFRILLPPCPSAPFCSPPLPSTRQKSAIPFSQQNTLKNLETHVQFLSCRSQNLIERLLIGS